MHETSLRFDFWLALWKILFLCNENMEFSCVHKIYNVDLFELRNSKLVYMKDQQSLAPVILALIMFLFFL